MGILREISLPNGVRDLSIKQLKELSEDIRNEIISVTHKNGGHLSANLGIVETTVALYNVFDFSKDKLLFDVGHQCYAHKILSGRLDSFSSIRSKSGLSGFLEPSESEFDIFSTGHAGSSISSAIGLCEARDKLNEDFTVINVVGDGSIVNGLNLEAITESEYKPKNLIVILNDNGMSISKNRNGFYRYISKKTVGKSYVKSKRALKRVFGKSFITKGLVGIRNFIKKLIYKENYFEKFGFKYVGIAPGNDVKELSSLLKKIKEVAKHKAVFLHLKTTKGKGLNQAEEQADIYHGIDKQNKTPKTEYFSSHLGEIINNLIDKDDKIVAITCGMKDGTGLKTVETTHPDNFYDVGIAEEYAVSFASGLAKGGLKPIVAVYSTFLQRAYDEIIENVCIDNLPVIFCLDRAGFVGEDGKTHQGLYDISYLAHIPNLTLLCPSSKSDLESAIIYALKLNSPVAIRYPKEDSISLDKPNLDYLEGLWQTLKEGNDGAILAVGPNAINVAFEVADKSNLDLAVINVRSVKPLDEKKLNSFKGKKIITIEENSLIGGFGSLVNCFYLNTDTKIINVGAKDKFVTHADSYEQRIEQGLDANLILKRIGEIL